MTTRLDRYSLATTVIPAPKSRRSISGLGRDPRQAPTRPIYQTRPDRDARHHPARGNLVGGPGQVHALQGAGMTSRLDCLSPAYRRPGDHCHRNWPQSRLRDSLRDKEHPP